jgi:hypothetical protein
MAIYRLPGFHLPLNNLPRANRRAERVFRREIPDENILQYYSDSDLRARYRFGREAILNIVRLIEEEIRPATNRSFPISATNQVLITLRFLATGSFLQVTGDTIAGADKSTVSRIVRRVTLAIARKLDDFVKFPGTQHEKALIKQGFYDLGGFPCVIGCVDGSHIRIIAPSANECNFVNRKGYHSINIQGICDHKGLFISKDIFTSVKRTTFVHTILAQYSTSAKIP